MKITIVGNGKVGDTLIRAITDEGHSVTVIDSDPEAIESAVNRFDVMGIVGNGASYETQKEAKVGSADLFIAVTLLDEMNMMSCVVAKKIGAKHTIARVRNPEYSRSSYFLAKQLGIDMIINPESQMAHEISRLLRFPTVSKVESFSKGRVEVVELKVTAGHPLAGKRLMDLEKLTGTRVLICTVMRNGEVIIPKGHFVIEQGDELGVAGPQTSLSEFFEKLGILKKKVRSAMIIGGGSSSFYLASRLHPLGIRTSIVESDPDTCSDLADRLPGVDIIHGDGLNSELLLDEGLENCDAFVALTGIDELNVVMSLFALNHGVGKVVTKITKITFENILENMGLDTIVSPRTVTVDTVLRYVRGIANSTRGDRASATIKTLYKLCDNMAEAIEFDVTSNFSACGVPLKDLKLKAGILIASVVRRDTVIIPGGTTVIEPGDSVIVVVSSEMQICDLQEILE